jgi:hypothetical protein
MRLVATFLVFVFVGGCTKSTENGSEVLIPRDTVYDGDIMWREKLELPRQVIQLDNGVGKYPRFVVGDTSILRIRIPRFSEYDMHLDKIDGATIIRVDTAADKFLVIPEKSQFSFILSQYYPKGKVIRYTRNWNESKAAYDEQVVSLDSIVEIGQLDFKAK